MADPLSMAGTIAGLAQIAALTYVSLSKYVRAAKDARMKTAQLATELRNASGILQNLSLLADSLSEDARQAAPGHSLPSLRASFVDDCHETIKKVDAMVMAAQKDFESGRKRDAIKRSLQAPFSETQVDELLKEMRRHTDILNLALNTDSLEALLAVGREQSRLADEVRELRDAVLIRFEIERRIDMDEDKQKILDFFLRVNPQTNLDTSVRLRQAQTGEWLTKRSDDFQKWRTIPGRKLWFNGIAGAGKTVLCGAVIQEALSLGSDTTAVAFFFCDYKNTKSHDPVVILSALAVQLALQKEACFGVLEDYYKSLAGGRGMGASLPKEPDISGLLEVLESLISLFGQVFIVVDGLDECGSHVSDVVRHIRSLAELHGHVNMALFSRNEVDIRKGLEGYHEINIEAQKDDLELYIAAEMHRRQELTSSSPVTQRLIHQALLSKAQGMFRWVSCQIDFLCTELDDEDRLAAIDKFPKTLDESYDRILEKVLVNHQKGNSLDIIRRALLWICARPGLPIEALREVLSVREGRNSLGTWRIPEDAISRAFSSLIRKSADGRRFELAHFTVQEYLSSIDSPSRLADFRFDRRLAIQRIRETSLRYLTLDEFNREGPSPGQDEKARLDRLEEAHPFYPHAVKMWARLWGMSTDGRLLEMAKVLFHPSKKHMFLNWLSRYLAPFPLSTGPSATTALRPARPPPTPRLQIPSLGIEDLMPGSLPLPKSPREREKANLEKLARQTMMITNPSFSTLHFAAALGWPELCKWLCIEGRADVNLSCSAGTPLFCAMAGLAAFTAGIGAHAQFFPCPAPELRAQSLTETVNILLEAGASDTTALNSWSYGKLALKVCANLGHSSPVEPFLARAKFLGSDMAEALRILSVHAGDREFTHDIFHAILKHAEEHPQVAEFAPLVSIAQARRLMPVNPDKTLPLTGSDIRDECATLELTTARIRDEDFPLSVEMAVRHNHVQEIKKLMADPRFDSQTMRFGRARRTIVHLAAEQDNDAALRILLDHGLGDSAQDNDGMRPIHRCAKSGVGSLRLLLGRGQSSCLQDQLGRTVYHHAARNDGWTVLQELLSCDPHKLTALRTACAQGRTPVADALYAGSERCALLLIKASPSEPAYFVSNVNVFILGAMIGSVTLFEALLEKNPGLDIPNPMHFLCQDVKPPFVQYLKKSYPTNERLGGLTPLERFLLDMGDGTDRTEVEFDPEAQFEAGSEHLLQYQPAVIRDLLADDHVSPEKPAMHIWDFFCTKVLAKAGLWIHRVDTVIQTVTVFKQAGVYTKYQEYSGQPVSVPLLGAMVNMRMFLKTLPRLVGMFLGPGGIETSDLGDHPAALACLRRTFLESPGASQIRKMLLARKVSIHAKLKRKSAIEEYFTVPHNMTVLRDLLELGDPLDVHKPADFESWLIHHIIQNWWSRGEELRYALGERDFDANATRELEESEVAAITRAIWTGQQDMIDMLLEYGADLMTAASHPEHDATYAAVCMGNTRILQMLDEKGFDDWKRTLRRSVTRPRGVIFTDGMGLLHSASLAGQVKSLEFLVDRGFLTDLEATSEDGLTPLHFAAMSGQANCVEFLISRGANLNPRDKAERLPLDLAFEDGRMPIVRKLLSAGADYSSDPRWAEPSIKEMASSRRWDGDNTLDEVDNKIIAGLLEASIVKGDSILFRALIPPAGDAPANSVVRRPVPSCGVCPPTLVAARQRQSYMASALLYRAPVEFRVHCPRHRTPEEQNILICVVNDRLLTAKLLHPLLGKLYVPTEHWSDEPYNAVHAAAAAGNTKALRDILAHLKAGKGISWKLRLEVMHADSPFLACKTDDDYIRAVLSRPTRKLGFVASDEEVAESDKMDGDSTPPPSRPASFIAHEAVTPLHLAARANSSAVVKLLLEHGVDVDARDANGKTPLMYTTSVAVAEQLLASGASLSARDDVSAYTPVAWAIHRDSLPLTRLLVSKGASLSVYNGSQPPPPLHPIRVLHINAAWHNPGMFAYLARQPGVDFVPEAGECSAAQRALSDPSTHPAVVACILNSEVWRGMMVSAEAGSMEDRSSGTSRPSAAPPANVFVDMLASRASQRPLEIDAMARRIRILAKRLPMAARRFLLNQYDPTWRHDYRHVAKGIYGSPLCMAARMGSMALLRGLLDGGALIDIDGSVEGTALMTACAFGRLDIIRELYRRGASVDYIDDNGNRRTAIETARAQRQDHVLAWLLVGRFTEQARLTSNDHVAATDQLNAAAADTISWRNWRNLLSDKKQTNHDFDNGISAQVRAAALKVALEDGGRKKRKRKTRFRPGVRTTRITVPDGQTCTTGETSMDTFLRLRRYRQSTMGALAVCVDDERWSETEASSDSDMSSDYDSETDDDADNDGGDAAAAISASSPPPPPPPTSTGGVATPGPIPTQLQQSPVSTTSPPPTPPPQAATEGPGGISINSSSGGDHSSYSLGDGSSRSGGYIAGGKPPPAGFVLIPLRYGEARRGQARVPRVGSGRQDEPRPPPFPKSEPPPAAAPPGMLGPRLVGFY